MLFDSSSLSNELPLTDGTITIIGGHHLLSRAARLENDASLLREQVAELNNRLQHLDTYLLELKSLPQRQAFGAPSVPNRPSRSKTSVSTSAPVTRSTAQSRAEVVASHPSPSQRKRKRDDDAHQTDLAWPTEDESAFVAIMTQSGVLSMISWLFERTLDFMGNELSCIPCSHRCVPNGCNIGTIQSEVVCSSHRTCCRGY